LDVFLRKLGMLKRNEIHVAVNVFETTCVLTRKWILEWALLNLSTSNDKPLIAFLNSFNHILYKKLHPNKLTKLVVKILISIAVQLQGIILVLILLVSFWIIITTRYRDKWLIWYNHCSKFSSIKLSVIRNNVCCQKWCCSEFSCLRMNGKDSLSNHQRRYMIIFYYLYDFFYYFLIIHKFSIIV
jgi:hypothetical protein